jgi:hypothetical protein
MAVDVVVAAHTEQEPVYGAPFCEVHGETSTSCSTPEGFEQFVVTGTLRAGSTLRWDAPHGDEAVFVQAGELVHDGVRCGTGDALIVESGARATIEAVVDTDIVHFGATTTASSKGGFLGVPFPAGHGVHVVHVADAPVTSSILDDGTEVRATWYADGVCRTCRLTLLRVAADGPVTGPSHHHSEDEVMCLLDGHMQVGPISVDKGMTVAIPAERRYGFRTKGAFEFINFRLAPCTVVVRPGQPPKFDLWNADHDVS